MRSAISSVSGNESSPPETSVGVYAEDLVVGTILRLGAHPMTQDAIIEFAAQWDPQFFHTDPERAAAEGPLGGLLASGLHTLSVYQRLTVLARTEPWHLIGGTGINDLRLRRPVRPGDVLEGTTTVSDQRLEPERRRGQITFAGRLTNQTGQEVLSLSMAAYLIMRPV